MASWVQPLDDPTRRVTIPHLVQLEDDWRPDVAWVEFEGRQAPVAARSNRETRSWTATTVWGADTRTACEAFLTLLRSVALEQDRRLEVHFEPLNGAWVDTVVQASNVPQQISPARTDVTVAFRRVDDTA